jgi:hypothetical protein
MKNIAQLNRTCCRRELWVCIFALLVGPGLRAAPAQAKDVSTIWTTVQESAPRSAFDEIRDGAPLAPVFETLHDSAP